MTSAGTDWARSRARPAGRHGGIARARGAKARLRIRQGSSVSVGAGGPDECSAPIGVRVGAIVPSSTECSDCIALTCAHTHDRGDAANVPGKPAREALAAREASQKMAARG